MIAVKIPRALKIIAAIYLAYLALIVLVAMPALNILAPKIYRQQTGLELKLEKIILLNPFTLALNVRNASGANADGSPFWAFDQLRADVSLASLWRRHLVLDALELRGLRLQIEQKNAERYNFSDILDYRRKQFPQPAPVPEPATNAQAIFPISIRKFAFSASHLGIKAPYWSDPLTLDLNGADIAVADFSSAAEKRKAPADAQDNAQDNALRSGSASIALQTIDIKLPREQQPLATQWKDLRIAAPAFATNATEEQALTGSVITSGDGRIDIKAAVALGARHASGSVTLHNLGLLPVWEYLAPKLHFTMQHSALDGDLHFSVNWADTLRYALRDSRLNLHDASLQSNLDGETGIAFASLQAEAIQVDSSQPRAQIGRIVLDRPVMRGWNRDAHVSISEMFVVALQEEKKETQPWHIQVDDIALQDGEVHWHSNQLEELPLILTPLDIHAANFQWPDAAPLQLEAKTTVNSQAAVAVKGSIVPTELTGALSGDIANLPLPWGNKLLQQQMHATLASGALNTQFQLKLEKAQPALLQLDGSVDNLELQSLPDKRKLLAWKKLQWRQLTVDNPKQSIAVRRLNVSEPWLQFRINEDGTNNFQQLLVDNPSPQPAAPAAKSAAKKPWLLAVDTVRIDKGVLDFRDNSLTTALRTNIANLSGGISNINNRGNGSAKVALKGSVDGYAPVALSGTFDPFAAPPAMDIALDITNLDLATLTPYSGTYAGYLIDSGRLSVQLSYTLENDRIKGKNHIVVNQLKLGKQVSGPKVMDLPLRIAIYLLTDENGVMDLGVDVAGSVDDPGFSVSGIIWKAFRNLIVKTVASPFRALARLAGGGEQDDLDRVDFGAGSDQISAEQNEKLRRITAALTKKPDLKVAVTGHVSPNNDIEALRDSDLSAQLIAQGGVDATDIQQQSKNWQRGVARLFAKRFPARKDEGLQPMQMNDAMRDNIDLSPDALQELAGRRALAVKQLLVTDMGLGVERINVKPIELGTDTMSSTSATFEVN